ncbi:type II toxin-antitoxin system Phd/YefM family antitoxin [Serratia ureilytica]|uniref:Type II toxin-antitoxin system Phd/YefM family antitoxin n=1 Tax=Serratia ureilytica TaxID=300181 RepID=A0ABU0VR39_9GAMM|nr:type II toxin-antitoxin system Phd/YefM family antitoxin [Serratia ureilytica]MDQ1811399.1 type II toxin-antitoxin system Phd/YefM family antitoxin [Serratia ureilytica]MDQ1840460.1 type II toxin-antitoxin system Phd/YefM family antitoxin [Serratia ureilytica]MDQ1863884.1 type II toxin-antitoxin system Phd/YefM family antitoxin [Serratia ureilytica]
MQNVILSESSASISELKKNPMRTVDAGNGLPVAILNRNQPAFYCVPSAFYEKMLDALDDHDLCRLVNELCSEEFIDVVFDQFT